MELTVANSSQMEDFDLAYAHEALARAHALQGNLAEARKYHTEADRLGHAISDPENQQIFLSDLQGGDWHDLN
jgi:mRNA-degrading endonuclease YafQ of YafQ-DinJ toxin-antitoxin module